MLSSLKRYRYQVPDDGWAKLAEEWTPAVSAQGWARTLREVVGLAMGGPADAQAIGGRLAGERPFDEDGVLLPEVVYAWADIQHLAAKAEPDERRPA